MKSTLCFVFLRNPKISLTEFTFLSLELILSLREEKHHSMLAVQLVFLHCMKETPLYESNSTAIFTTGNKVKPSFSSYSQLNMTLHFHSSRGFCDFFFQPKSKYAKTWPRNELWLQTGYRENFPKISDMFHISLGSKFDSNYRDLIILSQVENINFREKTPLFPSLWAFLRNSLCTRGIGKKQWFPHDHLKGNKVDYSLNKIKDSYQCSDYIIAGLENHDRGMIGSLYVLTTQREQFT